MPWGDGTGPAGMGPMTGRAAGYCAGYSVPGYLNPAVPGWGWGGGWGRGRGYRHWYYATGLPGWARFGYGPTYGYGYANPVYNPYYASPTVSKEQQLTALRNQAELLKKNLEDLNRTIADLEKEKQDEET